MLDEEEWVRIVDQMKPGSKVQDTVHVEERFSKEAVTEGGYKTSGQ